MRRHCFLRSAFAAAALLALGGAVAAPAIASEAYPSKPVTLIIPFPPGGTLDLVGRLLAQKLGEQTGQAFIIDNRPGGAGTIGGVAVAGAPADGYTLLFSAAAFTTVPQHGPQLRRVGHAFPDQSTRFFRDVEKDAAAMRVGHGAVAFPESAG